MNIYNGYVLSVVDGDTFDALVELGFGVTQKFRIRLDGIDAPERKTDEGEMVTDVVKRLIEKKPVKVIEAKGRDKYGRALARVETLDGRDLTDYLIEEGLGKEYHGGSKTLSILMIE